jgi:putative membrane protein
MNKKEDEGVRFQIARTSLANERTFLSWIRTSLALMSAGVALVKLLPHSDALEARVLGVILVLLGTGAVVIGYLRWGKNEQRIMESLPLGTPQGPRFLAAGMGLIALVALLITLIDGSD